MNQEKDPLPQRFRESSFREYEQFISNIVENFPNATKAVPSSFGKAQVTFACRLRDAIKSFHNNHWTSYINRDKFESIHERIVVSERTDGAILAGSKEGIERFANIGSNIPTSFPIPLEEDKSFIVDVLKPSKFVLAELSAAKKLAPRLTLSGLSVEDIQYLESNYDIALNPNEDGTYTLI